MEIDVAQIAVRAVGAEDVPTLAEWIAATPLWQRYGVSAAGIRANLERGLAADDLLLAADLPEHDEGRACGLAWCLRAGAFGRSPYLRLLGVRQRFARYGIGAALLGAAEAAFTGEAHELFLLVSHFNVAAQRFYQRQGYRHVGTLEHYVLADVDELLYWKRLPS